MCACYVGTIPRGVGHDWQCGLTPGERTTEVVAIPLCQSPALAIHETEAWDENTALIALAPIGLQVVDRR
jgi:hypothetical protein